MFYTNLCLFIVQVGRKEPYNELADVYSFSMLLWYIMSLEPPYCLYTDNMITSRVFVRGARPALFESWPEDISELIKQCWSNDIPDRPSFREVMTGLRDIVAGVDPITADLMALRDE
jgi:serine/threonine protein kinase